MFETIGQKVLARHSDQPRRSSGPATQQVPALAGSTAQPEGTSVGVVAIGRNEGDRLQACLRSVMLAASRIVYVDSGSTDESVAFARSLGLEVVELDASLPFTAARGRNAGFARLLEVWPDTRFVQFIDGDCQLDPGWIPAALNGMTGRPDTGVVFGRRRERYPFRTVFNYVCDREWDGPAGPAKTCGGDALVKVEAVQSVGGYDAALIAGEDDDFCHRLRRHGWTILRLPDEMTLHDAAMTSWQQWWQRSRRGGHALAEAWKRRGRGKIPR